MNRDSSAHTGLLLATMSGLAGVSLGIRATRRGDEDLPILVGLIALSVFAAVLCHFLPARLVTSLGVFARPSSTRTTSSAPPAFFLLATGLLLASALTQQFYWDERGISLAASGIATGGLAGLLEQYRENAWLGPQHPPLVPMLYASVAWLAGDSWFALRLLDTTIALGSLAVADRLLTPTIGRDRSVLTLCLLLASPLFLRLGSAVTSDIPALFFLLATLLAAWRLLEKPGDLRASLFGACLGLALLSRYTNALVVFPLAAMVTLLKPLPRPRRFAGIGAAAATLVCLPWLLLAWQHGLVDAQVEKMSRFAGNAASSGVFGRGLLEIFATRLPSALGVYLVPLLAIGVFRGLPLNRVDIFCAAWALGVITVVSLTAPHSRYMFPAFPALAALATLGLPVDEASRTRILLLALLLAGTTLAYYASIDLSVPMELFPGTSIHLG